MAAGEEGRIARVSDGDALALDTGLKVRLVEVEAPALGYGGRASDPYAEEARDALVLAATGRRAKLFYGGLSRDRYERALAHVIASDETGADLWLNGLMIRQGGARVRTFPDNARRARRLLSLEEEARTAKRGLWSLDHYRVRDCDDLDAVPNFAIVQGGLLEFSEGAAQSAARLSSGGVRLDLDSSLGKPDEELRLTAGNAVRIRGRIDTRGPEPLIRLSHWAQLEMA